MSRDQIVIKDGMDITSMTGNGRYQLAVLLVSQLVIFCCGMQEFIMNFVALDDGWVCEMNSTVCVYNSSRPADDKSRCLMERSEWRHVGKESLSIVYEFEMFCDEEYWIPLSTALFYIASMIGSPVFGFASDRYGRSRISFLCTTTALVSCFSAAFVPTFWLFQTLRFLTGFCLPGTYMTLIVLCSEIVSERYHNHVINTFICTYFMGVASLGLVANYIREWRQILIYSSAPYFAVIIFLWFVPESFLWLLNREDKKKLLKQLKSVSKLNRVKLPTNITFDRKKDEILSIRGSSAGFANLFQPRERFHRSIALIFAWISQGLIYYGTSLVANNITGNLYRDFILLTLIQITSVPIVAKTMDRFGRKKSTIANMVIAGVFTIATGLISNDPTNKASTIRLVFVLIAKVHSIVPYTILIMWGAELYSTDVRSKANGMFNCSFMLGGAIAPWVAIWLHHLHEGAPFYLMGGIFVLASLAVSRVSETHQPISVHISVDNDTKTTSQEEIIAEDMLIDRKHAIKCTIVKNNKVQNISTID